MKFIDYSPLALRTAKPLPHAQQVQHALLGLVTEVGELADCIKKHVVYGKELDKTNLMEECSDVFWYLNLYMHEKRLSSTLVDWAMVGEAPKSWDLVKAALFLTAAVSALVVEEVQKSMTDDEVVGSVVGCLLDILSASGFTLSDALTRNIDKLALRYGDKYSDYNALNRDTGAERVVLEGASGG